MDEIIDGVTDGGHTQALLRILSWSPTANWTWRPMYGPVQLPGSWDDYYDANGIAKGVATGGRDGRRRTDQLPHLRHPPDRLAIGGRDVHLPKSAWPYSWGATVATADGDIGLSLISMPNEWGVSNNREIHEVASHELAHARPARPVHPACSRAECGPLGHDARRRPLPAFHRCDPPDGRMDRSFMGRVLHAQSPGPVDQDVTLHPIELGTPPSGRKSVIEVRIADGFNYYFEYRSAQTAHRSATRTCRPTIGSWAPMLSAILPPLRPLPDHPVARRRPRWRRGGARNRSGLSSSRLLRADVPRGVPRDGEGDRWRQGGERQVRGQWQTRPSSALAG